MAGETRACAVEQAHHHLGVDEVFGTAQGDKAHGEGSGWGEFGHSSIVLGLKWKAVRASWFRIHAPERRRMCGARGGSPAWFPHHFIAAGDEFA
jgi:hypothetical protein